MKKIIVFLAGFIGQFFNNIVSAVSMCISIFLIFMSGLFYIIDVLPFIKTDDNGSVWIMDQLQVAIVFIGIAFLIAFFGGYMSLKNIMYTGEDLLSLFSCNKNKYRIRSNYDKTMFEIQYNIFGDTWVNINETHFCNNGVDLLKKIKHPVVALHEKYNIDAGRTPICPHPFSDTGKRIPYFSYNNSEYEYCPIEYFKTEEAAKYFLDCAITYLSDENLDIINTNNEYKYYYI